MRDLPLAVLAMVLDILVPVTIVGNRRAEESRAETYGAPNASSVQVSLQTFLGINVTYYCEDDLLCPFRRLLHHHRLDTLHTERTIHSI